jgi:hypothetical protein
MKAWIAALIVGAVGAGASWAQTPAFNQLAPAPGPSYALPFMPEMPSITTAAQRGGAQFAPASIPLPPLPAIVTQTRGEPTDEGQIKPPVDLNAPYLGPFEMPNFATPMLRDALPPPTDTNTRPLFWLNADYLFWWTKNAPQPNPLVTAGAPTDHVPAALGQPGTRVVYGGDGIDFNPFSGARVNLGVWCGPENRFGFEVGGFILQQRADQFIINGGQTGGYLLARPFASALTGSNDAFLIADGAHGMTGGIEVSSNSRLFGYEVNGLYNLSRSDGFAFNLIGGFTSVGLREKLDISEVLQNLSPTGGVAYLGVPVNPATRELTFDKFDTMNTFYGAQLGATLHLEEGQLGVDLTTKCGIGVIQQFVDVEGLTAVDGPNGKLTTTTPGGVYAVGTNIGRHVQNQFGFVPEGDVNFSYALTQNFILKAGFTFIYMNSVARPGNQINENINPAQVPSSPAFGTAGGQPQPTFQFHTSNFWAQGVNLGVEVRY